MIKLKPSEEASHNIADGTVRFGDDAAKFGQNAGQTIGKGAKQLGDGVVAAGFDDATKKLGDIFGKNRYSDRRS